MEISWHTTEHRARFGTATDHDVRVHLAVEQLPQSDDCDWLVWRNDTPLIRQSRTRVPLSKAIAAAEESAKSLLTAGPPAKPRTPATGKKTETVPM